MKRVYDEELIPWRDVIVDGYQFQRGAVYQVDHRDPEGYPVVDRYLGMTGPVTIRDLTPFRLLGKPRWVLGPITGTLVVLYAVGEWFIKHAVFGK